MGEGVSEKGEETKADFKAERRREQSNGRRTCRGRCCQVCSHMASSPILFPWRATGSGEGRMLSPLGLGERPPHPSALRSFPLLRTGAEQGV